MTNSRRNFARTRRPFVARDTACIDRYAKYPELGPKLLFFSGGTALNGLSRKLKGYSHNSTHLVTPFDSGGSSAVLRQAFDMPAVGDLRHRAMALADESIKESSAVYRFCRHRLPPHADHDQLRSTFEQMVVGRHELLADIPTSLRQRICTQLASLHAMMPPDFDLRRASVGNLIVAGAYFTNHQDLNAALELFSTLVSVQGTVRAIVNDNAHLAAELEDGTRLLGQHRITGKEVAPIQSPISQLVLTSSLETWAPMVVTIKPETRDLIVGAELICYAPGSFYTSLMANFLPAGVADAIATSQAPKVFIPNLGADPEQLGMGLDDSLHRLFERLAGDICKVDDILDYVLVDGERGHIVSDATRETLQAMGVELLDLPLVSDSSAPYYDDERLLHTLLSLVQ